MGYLSEASVTREHKGWNRGILAGSKVVRGPYAFDHRS
jgi:hypothetical protein